MRRDAPQYAHRMTKSDPRGHRKWKKLRAEILAASDTCWLCGLPGSNSVDHVLPVSKYPELALDIANLRPAHLSCNSARGARAPEQQSAYEPKSRRW